MTRTMPTGEARIMAALRDHGRDRPLTSRELQSRAGISETTVRVGTGELEMRGMIERRRSAWVLTADGGAFAASSRGQRVLAVPVARG